MSTATNNFVSLVGSNFDPDPESNVFDSLFKQYERVVFQSIITSFGLDAFIMDKLGEDRLGGDVDTIHNVRRGKDGGGHKNAKNEATYDNQGIYQSKDYHKGTNYQTIKHEAREKYQLYGQTVEDAYTGKDLHFLGKSKDAPPQINAELDHVVAANAIHKDRGRVLSGLDGTELANSPDNLKFTNKSLNASMQDKEIPDYISAHPELPEDTKTKMMEHYKRSKKSYDRKINTAYYTSPRFWQDTGIAAVKSSAKMGLRQAFGFVMTEVWFAVKDELAIAGNSLEEKLMAIASGIKRGFANAKKNFKEFLSKLGEGTVSGILSSLATTLCNIFFTTAKNVVRIIRQTWASVVEAAKILIFNPNCLPFSERMRAALKIIATGASIVLGTVVQESVHKALSPYIGAVPIFGDELLTIVSLFAGSLCTGFLTVSLLYFIDSDPFGGFLTKQIDQTIAEYKRQAKLFEAYAAELAKLDIEKFELETAMCFDLAMCLETVKDDRELNAMLMKVTKQIGVSIPWGNGSLDEFMKDKSTVLRFEA